MPPNPPQHFLTVHFFRRLLLLSLHRGHVDFHSISALDCQKNNYQGDGWFFRTFLAGESLAIAPEERACA
jgi:hypothetical protein